MNERIKEIIKQATTIEEHKWGVSYDNFDKEKFAELIVQECIDWIDGSPTTEEGSLILSKHFIIANLKQNFGVEE